MLTISPVKRPKKEGESLKDEAIVKQIQENNRNIYQLGLKFFDGIKTMPFSEYILLCQLIEKKKPPTPLNITQLTYELEVTKPAISRTVKALVDKEYVMRTIDPNDRRATYLELTSEGEEQCHHISTQLQKFMSLVYENIQEQELEDYLKMGNKIFAAMQAVYQMSIEGEKE